MLGGKVRGILLLRNVLRVPYGIPCGTIICVVKKLEHRSKFGCDYNYVRLSV